MLHSSVSFSCSLLVSFLFWQQCPMTALLYIVIMSKRACSMLVAISYVYSTFVSLLITIKMFNLFFCGYNVIRHFYCDSLPLLSLLCLNASEIGLIILISADYSIWILKYSGFNLVFSLLIVLVSYLLILASILRMSSAGGGHKGFSTCGSYLTVVTVFYGALIFMYVQP